MRTKTECRHRPRKLSLLRWHAGRGPYIVSSGEACRTCGRTIRLRRPGLAKCSLLLPILLLLLPLPVVAWTDRLLPEDPDFPKLDAALIFWLVHLLCWAAAFLWLRFGGGLFAWEDDDETALRRTTPDPDRMDFSVRDRFITK